nr:hypothetical protein [Tanacetum cinerariifolium]GEU62799.1 hypothetical protein [Tanacetum cinerariifolium]
LKVDAADINLLLLMMVNAVEEYVVDEAVNEEMDNSLVRATTTATSLDAELDRGVNTPQSGEDILKLNELMKLCTKLQQRVLDLEITKTTQALEIESLKRRVKKLERRKRSRTHGLKRLYKVGLSTRVESFNDNKDLSEEDASKQGRIADIDANEDIYLVNVHNDKDMFGVNDLDGDECMRTRSSSNLIGESSPNLTSSNPKHRNHRRLKQPFIIEESPVDMMADQRTMAELLRAPTEGYAEAIMVPLILAEHFELKHSLINMMTSDQFFGIEKDNPRDHIHWFNKITSTIKYKDVPNSAIKLMLFPFSLAGEARRWLEKEPSHLIRACPHHGFIELHQFDTFYNALNPTDQDSLNSAASGNLLERRTQDVLTIIKNKSKVCNSRNKSIVSQVKSSYGNSSSSSEIAKLTHVVNQQTSVVTTAMTAILKQFQATPPSASVKAVEEFCVTCGGDYP